jgi:hypothetical protein
MAEPAFAGPIVELRRARAFVRGHRLGVFQSAVGFKLALTARGDFRGRRGRFPDPGTSRNAGMLK